MVQRSCFFPSCVLSTRVQNFLLYILLFSLRMVQTILTILTLRCIFLLLRHRFLTDLFFFSLTFWHTVLYLEISCMIWSILLHAFIPMLPLLTTIKYFQPFWFGAVQTLPHSNAEIQFLVYFNQLLLQLLKLVISE